MKRSLAIDDDIQWTLAVLPAGWAMASVWPCTGSRAGCRSAIMDGDGIVRPISWVEADSRWFVLLGPKE